jgi:hypothetical protein
MNAAVPRLRTSSTRPRSSRINAATTLMTFSAIRRPVSLDKIKEH